MKTAKLIVPVLLACGFFAFMPQRVPPPIELVTNLTVKGTALKDYKAAVYKGTAVDTIHIVNAKPQFLSLEPGQHYTIFFCKDTLHPECIIVDTQLPNDVKPKKYRVFVNVEMDPLTSKQKKEGEDFPSAIIKYNKKLKNFEYQKEYHQQVHKQ